MGKDVLLINDLPGYGKVALAAMMPVMTRLGHRVYSLPTALVSNTLDYGKFAVMETTEYMRKTIAVWDALGFSFDAAAVGFIVSEAQSALIAEYCGRLKERGAFIFADPIMGDEGRLYNGVPESTVEHMRRLVGRADLIVPNYTEAALLAGVPYRAEGLSREEMKALIEALRAVTPGSVVVTSAKVEGRDAVAGYDAARGEWFFLPFSMIPVRFPGTGDIFSSVLLGHILRGEELESAVQAAMDTVAALIEKNRNNGDTFRGIPLEACLEEVR